MTVQEIAKLEQVGERQIQRYIAQGFKGRFKLPAVRVGRSYTVAESDYKAWRIACGFDTPAPAVEPMPQVSAIAEPAVIEAAAPEYTPPYPPWPFPADPNGELTNAPAPHSRNWPHPLAMQDHMQAETRKLRQRYGRIPDEK
jgi:excisionase family DNA binding protein